MVSNYRAIIKVRDEVILVLVPSCYYKKKLETIMMIFPYLQNVDEYLSMIFVGYVNILE